MAGDSPPNMEGEGPDGNIAWVSVSTDLDGGKSMEESTGVCSFQQIECSGHSLGQRRGCSKMGGQVRLMDLVNPSAPGECLDRVSR